MRAAYERRRRDGSCLTHGRRDEGALRYRLALIAWLPACSDLLGIHELGRAQGISPDASATDIAPLSELEAGAPVAPEPPPFAAAEFDAYYFARGAAYTVQSGEGVLDNDPPSLVLVSGAYQTERTGRVVLRPDGSFDYTPPSPSFWGDDHFEYGGRIGAEPEQKARVRLSIDLRRIVLAELEGGAGNGLAWSGSSDDPGCPDTGWVATAAGDVNGDGRDDIVIGAPLASPGGIDRAGAVYVVFGSARPSPSSLVNLEADRAGFSIHGVDAGASIGTWTMGAGDINGDGLDDIVTGAPYTTAAGLVGAFVVFGKAGGATLTLGSTGIQGGLGFVIRADVAPRAIAAAGDVNGDGRADVIVALPELDAGGPPGSSVVFGKTGPDPVALANIPRELGGGFSISAGDSGDLIGTVS